MLNSILIDAGPLIALFNAKDKFHSSVRAFLKEHPYRYVSTLAVLTEVSHMLDFSRAAQHDFYEWVMCKGVIISDINQNDMPRLLELTDKYADLPMDFADGTLVITAEKTCIREIISLDKDFDIYRLPGREQIRNVFGSEKPKTKSGKINRKQVIIAKNEILHDKDAEYWKNAPVKEKLQTITYLRECFYGKEATTGRLQRFHTMSKRK